MNRVQIKICGVTTREDAQACADAGAEMIGLNFWAGSSRFITPDRASEIIAAVSPRTRSVGVFVDATVEKILAIAQKTGIDSIQLHGNTTVEICRDLANEFRIIRALSTNSEFRPEDAEPWRDADLLLDAHHPHLRGGTGLTCDWEMARLVRPFTKFLMLSGGLNERNVAEAIATVSPDAVDVCSGVERAPGVKDHRAVSRFIAMARGAVLAT